MGASRVKVPKRLKTKRNYNGNRDAREMPAARARASVRTWVRASANQSPNCFILPAASNGKHGMDAQWVWWILAAILIGAELLSGTFYLLAIGVAMALGGMVAFAGAGAPM